MLLTEVTSLSSCAFDYLECLFFCGEKIIWNGKVIGKMWNSKKCSLQFIHRPSVYCKVRKTKFIHDISLVGREERSILGHWGSLASTIQSAVFTRSAQLVFLHQAKRQIPVGQQSSVIAASLIRYYAKIIVPFFF